MSKKSSGILPLLVGAAAGAAAVFFSDKKNRDVAKQKFAAGKKKVRSVSAAIQKDPEGFAKRTAAQVQREAQKLANRVSKEVKKNL